MTSTSETVSPAACQTGVDNLLDGCLELTGRESVLMVVEQDHEAVYEPELVARISAGIEERGCELQTEAPALIRDISAFPPSLYAAMAAADRTLFLSRVGDYLRFDTLPGKRRPVLSYVRSLSMLASPLATVSHGLMQDLHDLLVADLEKANHWRITCTRGTDIEGEFDWQTARGGARDDFSLSLFPATTFMPASAATARGKVALSRWLLPVAAPKVADAEMTFDGTVTVTVSEGRVQQFDGPADPLVQVRDHHERVARTLGIDRDRLHSWHIGMNPLVYFDRPAKDHLEEWGAISFGSPRYLHFHTCGNTSPGEIAWSVFNPDVYIDGECYWQAGQLAWLRRKAVRSRLEGEPDAERLLGRSADIGTE